MPRLVNRIATVGLLALLPACASMRTAKVKNTSKNFSTVVVDAGHGGKDSGAYRRYGPPEKMIALDVAQRLNSKFRKWRRAHSKFSRATQCSVSRGAGGMRIFEQSLRG